VAVDATEPAGEQRAAERADGERGVEQPGGLLAAAVHLLGQRREQRARHGEDHGDQVHDEGHQQHLPAAQEAQALQHAGGAGPPAAAERRHRRQAADREQRRAEAHGVQPVRPGVAVAGDEQSGEQRSQGDREVELHLLERVRRRQQSRRSSRGTNAWPGG
jgi:hypothetical protein